MPDIFCSRLPSDERFAIHFAGCPAGMPMLFRGDGRRAPEWRFGLSWDEVGR